MSGLDFFTSSNIVWVLSTECRCYNISFNWRGTDVNLNLHISIEAAIYAGYGKCLKTGAKRSFSQRQKNLIKFLEICPVKQLLSCLHILGQNLETVFLFCTRVFSSWRIPFFDKAPSFEAREAHRYLNNRLGIFRARGGGFVRPSVCPMSPSISYLYVICHEWVD